MDLAGVCCGTDKNPVERALAYAEKTWHDLSTTYLPFYLLMAWSEALTTGVIITLMVVYRPPWVATFDDKAYIENR